MYREGSLLDQTLPFVRKATQAGGCKACNQSSEPFHQPTLYLVHVRILWPVPKSRLLDLGWIYEYKLRLHYNTKTSG